MTDIFNQTVDLWVLSQNYSSHIVLLSFSRMKDKYNIDLIESCNLLFLNYGL
jgi:hypothetical protein